MTAQSGLVAAMTPREVAEGCASLVRDGCKIGLIGRIDPQRTLMDGQTVKTRTIYELLLEAYGADDVVTVDTRNYRHEPVRVMLELKRCLANCDSIMALLSSGGRKALFPILAHEARRRDKRIYHNLIGGHLAEDVASDGSGMLAGYLRSFEVNWVESEALVKQLAELGIPNAEYLPNFKLLPKVEPFEEYHRDTPCRFVMFSRVQPEKGVETAARAIAHINGRSGGARTTLDIYGPIKPGYEEDFERLVADTPAVDYCGSVDASESVQTLMDYSCLLFPTSWPGEGIPGTIIDALCAGLPVIASRWRCYDEMLENGKTGLSYDYDRPEDLEPTIEAFMRLDDSTLLDMKNEALARSERYSAEEAFATMVRRIESDREGAR